MIWVADGIIDFKGCTAEEIELVTEQMTEEEWGNEPTATTRYALRIDKVTTFYEMLSDETLKQYPVFTLYRFPNGGFSFYMKVDS